MKQYISMLAISLSLSIAMSANVSAAEIDYKDNKGKENLVKLSPKDLQHLQKIGREVNGLSIEASKIIERTVELPRTSPNVPVAKFTFSPGRSSQDVLIDVIRIDGDIIWVGCMQDPPGVSCSGPCPCE